MQKEQETINMLPPEIIQVFEENVYAQIANSVYVIREQKSKKLYDIPNLEISNCSVLDDILYMNLTNVNGERIQAIQANDKVPLWTSLRKNILLSPPLIKKDKIYLCEKEGISALNTIDGMPNWQCSLDSWFSPLITIQDKIIYALSQGSHPVLYMLDSHTGKIFSKLYLSPPLPTPATSLVATHQTISLNLPNGCMVWNIPNGSYAWQYNDVSTFPKVAARDGQIYLSYPKYKLSSLEPPFQSRNLHNERGGFIYALREKDGSLLWKYQLCSDGLAGTPTLPIIAEEMVYIGISMEAEQRSSLYAFHAESSSPLWSYQVRGTVISSPFVKENIVYFGLDDGYVYALQAHTGSLLWKSFVSTSHQMGMRSSPLTVKRVI